MISQVLIANPSEEKEIQFSTNEVLKEEKSNRTLYYLPCYVRFKVKQLLSVDIEGLQGQVSGTLLFTFYYGNLNRDIVDQFVGEADKAILLQFSRQDSVLLKEDKGITYKEDTKNKLIDFVIRQDFTCNLVGDVFYTPFEVINLYLTITIQSIPLDPKQNDGRRIDIKFNCMQSDDVSLISHGEKVNLGNYNLASYFLSAKYSNSDKNPYKAISIWNKDEDVDESKEAKRSPKIGSQRDLKLNETKELINLRKAESDMLQSEITSPVKLTKEEDSKIKNFQYVHFRIPLYQYPGANLINIFIPLWVLGFINLLIFFQDMDLGGRLGIISTLTLAFIAFVPTINEKIPQTPYIKLVQIIIYMGTLATILCMIDSLLIWRTQDPTVYVFDWSTDGWFIASLVINLVNVFVVMVLFILHKVYWERVYIATHDLNRKEKVLLKQSWNNKQCDKYFHPHIVKGKIKVI